MDRDNFNKLIALEDTCGLDIRVLEETSVVHAKVYRKDKKHSVVFMDIFVVVPNEDDCFVYERLNARNNWPHAWFNRSEVGATCRMPVGYIDGEIVTMNAPIDPVPYFVRYYGADWNVPCKTHSHHNNQKSADRMNTYYPISVSISTTLIISFCIDYALSSR